MKVIVISKKQMIIWIIGILLLFISIVTWLNQVKGTASFTNDVDPIRSGDPKSNKMAITCNVDWGNEVIPDMLKILDEKGIKITFFITGRWAKNNPELLKEIYDRGHEIGNHGYSHKMHSKIGQEENLKEIKNTEDVIKNTLGIKCRYFAPPSGDFNETTLRAASTLGYRTILWSIDTIDWKEGSTSEVILHRVIKKPHHGAILLMHPKPETVKALPYIIDNISEKNIEIGSVSNLLE